MARVDLDRFRGMRSEHDRALAEIRSGRKRSHWMWYVFPQIAGLGFSDMARRYGITSLDAASAYLDDSVLGSDYAEMVDAVWHQVVERGVTVHDLFGAPDDTKLVSSLTLFAGIARRDPELPEFVARADDILSRAHTQGLAPCRTTLYFLEIDSDAG
jgi:uncharacterized protein (DUF1810 family)